jgi:hypothetical protein
MYKKEEGPSIPEGSDGGNGRRMIRGKKGKKEE